MTQAHVAASVGRQSVGLPMTGVQLYTVVFSVN
jgi:hypothetical protein